MSDDEIAKLRAEGAAELLKAHRALARAANKRRRYRRYMCGLCIECGKVYASYRCASCKRIAAERRRLRRAS